MIYSQILVAIILIACGFLAKKYPNLIAGYNTLSQVEKDKININELSTFLKQLLIGLGIITIINYSVLSFLNFSEVLILNINTTVLIIVLVIGLIYASTNKKLNN